MPGAIFVVPNCSAVVLWLLLAVLLLRIFMSIRQLVCQTWCFAQFCVYWLYFSFALKRSRLGRRIGVRAYIWINRLRSDPLISFNLYLTYFVNSVLFGSHLSRIRPIQIIWISLPVPYACVYRYSIFIHTLHLRLWFSAFSFRFLSEHALQISNSGLTFDNLDTSRTWQSHILLASLTHNNPHTHTFGAVSVWFLLSLFAFHWHF